MRLKVILEGQAKRLDYALEESDLLAIALDNCYDTIENNILPNPFTQYDSTRYGTVLKLRNGDKWGVQWRIEGLEAVIYAIEKG